MRLSISLRSVFLVTVLVLLSAPAWADRPAGNDEIFPGLAENAAARFLASKLSSSRPRNSTPIGLKALDKQNAFAQLEGLTFLVVPVSYWFNPIIANRATLELSTAR